MANPIDLIDPVATLSSVAIQPIISTLTASLPPILCLPDEILLLIGRAHLDEQEEYGEVFKLRLVNKRFAEIATTLILAMSTERNIEWSLQLALTPASMFRFLDHAKSNLLRQLVTELKIRHDDIDYTDFTGTAIHLSRSVAVDGQTECIDDQHHKDYQLQQRMLKILHGRDGKRLREVGKCFRRLTRLRMVSVSVPQFLNVEESPEAQQLWVLRTEFFSSIVNALNAGRCQPLMLEVNSNSEIYPTTNDRECLLKAPSLVSKLNHLKIRQRLHRATASGPRVPSMEAHISLWGGLLSDATNLQFLDIDLGKPVGSPAIHDQALDGFYSPRLQKLHIRGMTVSEDVLKSLVLRHSKTLVELWLKQVRFPEPHGLHKFLSNLRDRMSAYKCSIVTDH